MQTYRLCAYSQSGRLERMLSMVAASDGEACARADALQEENGWQRIELWRQGRNIHCPEPRQVRIRA